MIEKIKKEIEQLKALAKQVANIASEDYSKGYNEGQIDAFDLISSFIESLEQEQITGYISNPCAACVNDKGCVTCEHYNMRETQPQGLDEAAEDCISELIPQEVHTTTPFAAEYVIKLLDDAFKAGAEWMAEQGWHEEAVIKGSDDVVWLNYNVELPIDLAKYFKDGDKVVVQIRKK